jgi:predicted secreted hydrolase
MSIKSYCYKYILAAGLGFFAGQALAEPASASRQPSVNQLLGGPAAEDFERAYAPREFQFPQDHGPHPRFRNEWWYFTGNLATAEGRRFGYELTIFRTALKPAPDNSPSAWRNNQFYTAHLALTDATGARFYAVERHSRPALGLAGAQAEPFRVWLEDWEIAALGETQAFPIRLKAKDQEIAVDLRLEQGKSPVLQGDKGLSQKSAEPGNASYYYSLMRMPTAGSLRAGGREYAVTGSSWMDREWSTSALGKNQAGWDWFALQLSDGREIMYYQLRTQEGGSDALSAGTLVHADGSSQRLKRDDVRIEVLDRWRNRDGTSYPARWRFSLPGGGLSLEIAPILADQELKLSARYWEGAVSIAGLQDRTPISGQGYVELVGYAAPR